MNWQFTNLVGKTLHGGMPNSCQKWRVQEDPENGWNTFILTNVLKVLCSSGTATISNTGHKFTGICSQLPLIPARNQPPAMFTWLKSFTWAKPHQTQSHQISQTSACSTSTITLHTNAMWPCIHQNFLHKPLQLPFPHLLTQPLQESTRL